ncbi:MAG: IgGFc-binding protein [Polyangiaceae bacterium]|nr:IgGFc-binding protein [Polyangiaceae bacterium]
MLASAFSSGCSADGGGSSVSGGNGGSGNSGGSGGTSGAGAFGGTGGLLVDAGGSGGGTQQPGVPETCEEAIRQKSYIGCEYWPTVTSNGKLNAIFEFAVVAANPTKSTADVIVRRGGNQVAQQSIPPGGIVTIKLPWVSALRQDQGRSSVQVAQGAYHVESSVPITLYQFNPLEFRMGATNSSSNDASLLLPTTALGTDYYAMTYPTLHLAFRHWSGNPTTWLDDPGFIAITATEDGTEVTVTSTAHTRSGSGVGALSPGQTGTYQLNRGDVLQLVSGLMPAQETPLPGRPCGTQLVDIDGTTAVMCPSPPEYDLTGSRIQANKRISVIAGHDCTFIPYSRWACDHIEESMFPTETLGQDLIVTAPQSVRHITTEPGRPDNMFVRVMSAADGNTIDFDPPVNPSVTLNAGQWIEIGPVTQDFRVRSGDRVMVAQFMVGEDFQGSSAGAGDPALSVAIPVEQYRVEYTFLAPATFTYNYVNVIAKPGAQITLNGSLIDSSRFSPVGSTGYSVARLQVPGGAHAMKGDDNFGIVVYGYAPYTSYMYPGGLNLEKVEIIPR